ncbi:hypothetical protein TRICI_006305 [Trichomonascus ciferrii]|uniref:Condensation domain-containing protein n=1 Tax=Trichomonascus ciferrii TaxID=44093 RepID=A0A642UIL2_9ASCO|nr:hypothetical protein TRICI_006305 [Trichomonascus ciferrii]
MNGVEGYFHLLAELAAKTCEGRQNYLLFSVVNVELGIEDVVGSLRKAWVMMRHSQPHLATFVQDDKFVYETPGTSGLAKWLNATFVVADENNAQELAQHVKPIRQATLYYLPKSSELVLRCSHHLMDGIGTLMFWHCFFTAVANPQEVAFGDEKTRLPPTLERVLGFPETPRQDHRDRANEIFTEWASNIPAIGVPNSAGEAPSKQAQRAGFKFSQQTTTSLVQVCKQRGVSVTAAVHAALIRCLMKYADPTVKQSEYRSVGQFNLQNYLPAPYNSTDYAVSTYFCSFPYNIDLPAPFWELAKDLGDYYKTTFKTDPELLEIGCELMRTLYNAFQLPEVQNSPISKDPLFSSLGIVENHLQRTYGGSITVREFLFSGDCVAGMSAMFIYTFCDQLRLVSCFNDGFQNPCDIQTYAQEIQNILIDELELK